MNLPFQNKHQRRYPPLQAGQARQAGFSLLEMMIVMGILVFISFGIYQATTDTFRLRDTLGSEGDFYNAIRIAMSILDRDVTLIYSPVALSRTDPLSKSHTKSITAVAPTSSMDNPGAVSLFWSTALDASGIRPSRFMGEPSKVSFISTSHIRMYKGSPESVFAKISYAIEPDPDSSQGLSRLVKSQTTDAFNMDDVRDPLLRTYVILKGIKSFVFTYYQRDGLVWRKQKQWDTEREETRNVFPDFIELSIEVISPKKISYEGVYRFRPEIPFYGVPAKF